jgi:thiosulfate/3-mercaptopyruvate sulfurtransferase
MIFSPSPFLVTPEQLAREVFRGTVTLVDIRDREDYLRGHLPGAINIPQLFYYLAETTEAGLADLHLELQILLSRAGIVPERPVVVYEESLDSRYGGSCRGCWLLTYAGHPAAGVLDGGLSAWRSQGLPLEEGDVIPLPSLFPVRPRSDLIATRGDVAGILGDPRAVLLDNRDLPEWEGESSSPYGVDFAPRKGRLPGARRVDWNTFLDSSGNPVFFHSPGEIRRFAAEHGLHPDQEIILYCFKGSRSSNTWIALHRAGFRRVRLFLGSWNEWSRNGELPVAEVERG